MAIKRFPGLIDAHVHLREPGATHKEDFYTASRAAVKGGFAYIMDMPNNPLPTVSLVRLKRKIYLSRQKAVCDIGFYYGTNGRNFNSFKAAWLNQNVFGLKIYCNHTTGDLLIDDLSVLEEVFKRWESDKPILAHAENTQLATVVALAHLYNRRLHICHLSKAGEVELVRRAKTKKQKITCGVCPHHLYLTEKDRGKMKGYAEMKPSLGTRADQNSLWQALGDGVIDIVESDHAPHTKEEKEKDPPAFGVPGLETTFGLMLLAVKEKKITEGQLLNLLYYCPRKIFRVSRQPKTYFEIDTNQEWIVGQAGYETKCGWSPFNGWTLPGVIKKLVFRGKTYAPSAVL